MKNMTDITFLPNRYFKGKGSYWALWAAFLKNYPHPSRSLPDHLTLTMSELTADEVRFKPHIQHWHQISGDDDERSLRNLIQSDGLGHPKRHSNNIDLLRYIDMCLQYVDADYRSYVESWVIDQVFDEEDDR